MPRRKYAEELTAEELRQLLMEKHRNQRQNRLDVYRRTGRVILVENESAPSLLEGMSAASSEDQDPARNLPPQRKSRLFLDRLLFLIEVAAVIGLGYILFSGAAIIRSLNQEVSAALQQQPTLTPTAIITNVVLPSGHTPPINGVTQFNEEEIPEHLRPLVQSMSVALTLPTPSPEYAKFIKVPAIHVAAPIVQGDGWEQLKKGVGQHLGTPNPGQAGNLVLSAHNDVFGELFRYLDQLKPGDEVVVLTQQKSFTYAVREVRLVQPSQVEVLADTHEPTITLISCYPYMVDKQRIVVTADLVNP